jgi:hypothetical protein
MIANYLKIFAAIGFGMLVGVATQTHTFAAFTAVVVMMIPIKSKELP